MNRVSHLLKLQADLERRIDGLGVGIFDVLYTRKRPKSAWLRRSMALDILLARARASARPQDEEHRRAELAWIRRVHQASKAVCLRNEEVLLAWRARIAEEVNEVPAGGVN